jgi:outer membrane protein OmpA-like peptidoglycan-associated protein/tetratricopeptide (TPR) repeat protein
VVIRKLFIFFSLLLSALYGYGQHYNADAVPAKARRWYDRAMQTIMLSTEKDQAQTIQNLQKAIEEYPEYLDAYVQLGSIYEQNKKYDQALSCFDKAYQIDSAYFLPGYLLYAKAKAGAGRFAEALQLTDHFLAQANLRESSRQNALKWKAHFTFGLESLRENIPFQPVNLGDSINTADPEYFPSLPIDQKMLIFTRNLHNRNEDFFISHLLQDTVWSKALPISGNINSVYNEGGQTISQDGKVLLYTICNRPGGMGSCDIYYAVKTDSGWSPPQNMGPPVNSPYWDTQPCLSPDNHDLYFVSNRPGGYGGSDIYVCHLQPDGRWSKPQNLGPDINTPGDESSPFIHADNQTLYFASSGLPGLGGVDLYYVRRNPDGSWNKPHNLGYPINTIDHDGSLFVAADGKTAYFASDRSDSRGQLDIYRFTLYPAARPVRTLYVEGYVFDQKTNNRLNATIDLIDLATGKVLTHIPTDPDGSYMVTLPVGKDYAFNVGKPGYLFYSDHFSLRDTTKWKPFYINIGLQPIELNAHITLNNIFFDFDQYTLKAESHIELDKLVQLLQANPAINIQINGYTDSAGTAQHNLLLSQQRAQAVVNYLVSKGIAAGRLRAKGYGASHPVASNDTAEGRARNRRTELIITGK